MPRSERYEVRVTPEVSAAMRETAGLASASRWIEFCILKELHSTGVSVEPGAPDASTSTAKPSAPAPTLHDFGRRPASRIHGGRKQR